jgi:hypothetical protein
MTFSRSPFLITSRKFPFNEEELPKILNKMYFDISQAVNTREISFYERVQTQNGQKWFNDNQPDDRRQGFRKAFSFGAINAGNSTTLSHSITEAFTITALYGTCSTSLPDQRPIPYSSTTDVQRNISIRINTTDILIFVGANSPNVTSGFCVVEYLLN